MLRSPSYAWRSQSSSESEACPCVARRAKQGATRELRRCPSNTKSLKHPKVHYVYLIRSDSHPKQSYVGYSTDLKKRLHYHNQGDSPHTAKYKPWSLAFYAAFPIKTKALEFETYLKSHSGKAFIAKRLA